MRHSSIHSFAKSKRKKVSPRIYVPVLMSLFSMVIMLVCALFIRQSKLQAESKATKIPVTVIAPKPISRIEVVVPRTEIQAGTLLTPDLFQVSSVIEREVNRNVIRSLNEVQGFYARALLVQGQPVSQEYLTPAKPVSELTGAIPEGYRAVTIRVDERTSVEGWARAGARVDVVWASTLAGRNMISVIVENAKVLSAERQVNPEPEPKKGKEPAAIPTTVTLLVKAEDASRIQLASVSGMMSLSLRGLNDSKANKSAPLTVDDLLANGKAIDPNAAPRVVLSVKGQKGETVEYAMKEGELVAVK